MENGSADAKGSNVIVYFVLGALVVAVAALAFLALGGQLGGSAATPQTVIVTPPATPAPAPTDHNDHRDRNDHNDRPSDRPRP